MGITDETIDYFRTDFGSVERELEAVSEPGNLYIEINDDLEEALLEIQSLREQISSNESAKLRAVQKYGH